MGKASRDKGARGELEFAKLVGGHRVPLSGAVEGYGNDVVLPNGMKAEVKRRASGFKTLYEWVLDEREKPDIVAFRADRKPWLVTMTAEKYRDMMDDQITLNHILNMCVSEAYDGEDILNYVKMLSGVDHL